MKRIIWVGRFLGNGSFAVATRRYFKALLPYFQNIFMFPLEDLPSEGPYAFYVRYRINEIQDEDFIILNHLPSTDPEAHAYLSVYEYNGLPSLWREAFLQARFIMTQSRYCRDLFSHYVDREKIFTVGYILGEEFLNFQKNGPLLKEVSEIREKNPDAWIFGSVFEWVPRKFPQRMIIAFLREFLEDPNVYLLLKTHLPKEPLLKVLFMKEPNGEKWYGLFKEAIKKQRIRVVSENFPSLDIFYRSIDCYLSPTAGEGFGQTLAEAMACGRPTIGSNHSGNLDFMNESNSFLVDTEEWTPVDLDYDFKPLDPKLFVDKKIPSWKPPKIKSIAENMRRVYELKETSELHELCSRAREIIHVMTPQYVGKRMASIIFQFFNSE